MEQRRLMMVIALWMAVFLGWQIFVLPLIVPPKPKADAEAAAALAEAEPADALAPENLDRPVALAAQPEQVVVDHPARMVEIGSSDPASGFYLHVRLTSRGAAVETVDFNDVRYRSLEDKQLPLRILGADPAHLQRTFSTRFPDLPGPGGAALDARHWEVVPGSESPAAVAFRIDSPDGSLRITKTYSLTKCGPDESARDEETAGYELRLAVAIENRGTTETVAKYELQGPVGVPLEDPENASKFRDVRLGFLRPDGETVDSSVVYGRAIVDQFKKDKLDVWQRPVKYLGIDTQYFAALVCPEGKQTETPAISSASPQLLFEHPERIEFSDVSVVLRSAAVTLGASGGPVPNSLTHEYALLTTPKRAALLAKRSAEAILTPEVPFFLAPFYWVGVPVSGLMLGVLNSLHWLGLNYGLAIVALTVLVRSAMFPLTIKQTQSMQRMKEAQPKLKALQEKFKDDREAFARAQMDFMRENNVNPLAGCLPMLLQMPIFIGLYMAIGSSVDLRQASFLWMDNLAGPDKLFPLGFKVPWFGWTDFNLLPLLSIALMLVQQKLTMPPATDPEQEAQQRMMTVMMCVMGFMFYRMPSGLCIYFIISSAWGVVERWLVEKIIPTKGTPAVAAAGASSATPAAGAGSVATSGSSSPASGGVSGWWNRMLEAADKEMAASRPGQLSRNGDGASNDEKRSSADKRRDKKKKKR